MNQIIIESLTKLQDQTCEVHRLMQEMIFQYDAYLQVQNEEHIYEEEKALQSSVNELLNQMQKLAEIAEMVQDPRSCIKPPKLQSFEIYTQNQLMQLLKLQSKRIVKKINANSKYFQVRGLQEEMEEEFQDQF